MTNLYAVVFFLLLLVACSQGNGQDSPVHFRTDRFRVPQGQDVQLASYMQDLYYSVKNAIQNEPSAVRDKLWKQSSLLQNISRACAGDWNSVFAGLTKQEMWALKLLDAMGKTEAGILDANLAWLGSYEECINVTTPSTSATQFRGKYCTTSFRAGQPVSNANAKGAAAGTVFGVLGAVRLGLCVPESCSAPDMERMLNNLLSTIPSYVVSASFEAHSVTCEPRDIPYDGKAIGALCLIGIFGALVTVGTLYDIILLWIASRQSHRAMADTIHKTSTVVTMVAVPSDSILSSSEKETAVDAEQALQTEEGVRGAADPVFVNGRHPDVHQESTESAGPKACCRGGGLAADCLMAFSLYSNGKKILCTAQADSSLTCIHGIRFLTMTWVVLGHSYLFSFGTIRNVAVVPAVMSDFWFQAVLNATVAVDTFFVMSGLLLVYLFVISYEKTHNFPVIRYYVHRYWRLTGVYAVVLFLYFALFQYSNEGPQWNGDAYIKPLLEENCGKRWWASLLYVNNFVDTKRTSECMGWTWYLANDMQFYWVSPVILFPLVRKPWVGLTIMGLFFVAHVAATAVITTQYKMSAVTAVTGPEASFSYYDKYYIKPWTRIGPYLVGMFCGYLLAKYRRTELNIHAVVVAVLWTVSAVMATAVLYGLWDANSGHPLTPEADAAYMVLYRIAWATSVSWVIFACVKGYGGFVNTLLSWKALVPLSRLTYCVYLLHLWVETAYFQGLTTLNDFTHSEEVYQFFGNLVTTYGLAFVLTICVESPLLSLEKAVEKSLARRSKSSREKKTTKLDKLAN